MIPLALKKLAATGAVLMALGAVSCRRPQPPPQRPLRVALEADVLALDPTLNEINTQSALSNVFESLVDFDRDMHLVPSLAARWSTPDEKTWVFEIRPEVRFHDGTTLTAREAAASLTLVKADEASGMRGLLSSVVEAVALDERRLRILTRAPHPLLLHDLAHVPIVKGRSLESVKADPIGTGPYRFVRWVRGRELELEAFDGYWKGRPSVSRAVFVVRENGEASIGALERCEVDLAPVPPRIVFRKPRPPFDVRASSGLSTWFLWINSLPTAGRSNPLSDRRIRSALSLAVDRSAVARLATGHANAAAEQHVPKTIFGYARDLPPPPFDPAQARRLRISAGRLGQETLVLWHRTGEGYVDVAALVAANLRDAGFRVETRGVPWAELVDGFTKRRYGLSIVGWVFDSGDAGSFFRDTIHSRRADEQAGTLNPGFEDLEIDRLVDDALSVFDGPTRLARFEELMRRAREAVPAVPLFHQPYVWGAAKELRWQPRVDGHIRVSEISFGPKP